MKKSSWQISFPFSVYLIAGQAPLKGFGKAAKKSKRLSVRIVLRNS
jgi:hypothetical protein